MSVNDLMALSVKRFWFLANQIDRIEAADRLNQMEMLASVTSQEGYKMVSEKLVKTVGQVYVWKPHTPKVLVVDPDTGLDPEFDRAGLQALKARVSSGRVM
ncbi:hypothetical protein [Agrobacterium sp. CG674]